MFTAESTIAKVKITKQKENSRLIIPEAVKDDVNSMYCSGEQN